MLGERMDVERSLAARLISQLHGPARRAAMALSDEDLQPMQHQPPILGDNGATLRAEIAADLKHGIKNVLNKLGRRPPRRSSATGVSRRYWRKNGERMTEYSVRFDEGLQKLGDDGVLVSALNPMLGWWFVHMAGLTGDRKERVVAALSTDGYELEEVRRVCCRLLAEVHVGERAPERDRQALRPPDRAGDRDPQRPRPSGKGSGTFPNTSGAALPGTSQSSRSHSTRRGSPTATATRPPATARTWTPSSTPCVASSTRWPRTSRTRTTMPSTMRTRSGSMTPR